MLGKILKCKRNNTEVLTFEDTLTLEKLHELIPNRNKIMTVKVDNSLPDNHLNLPSTFEDKKRHNKHALYNARANETLEYPDGVYNTEDEFYHCEKEDEHDYDKDDEDDNEATFTRLVKQMFDTHREKKIQASEKSIEDKKDNGISLSLSSSPFSSFVASRSESLVFSNKKEQDESTFHPSQFQFKTQTGNQNPLTWIHKTLEKQLQDLSELFQREIINVMRVLDYPSASKAMDKLFEFQGESVGFIHALTFIINHITKSIARNIVDKKVNLSTDHINNLRKQFLQLTTSIERLRRTRVKVFSKFNKQIHSHLDLMIQTNDFNLDCDTRSNNLLSLPMSHRVGAGGFLNEVADENSYENLYWGNYSAILSSLRKEGNKLSSSSSSGKNEINQDKNSSNSNLDTESIINKIQVPPGEMEIKFEAWKRTEINCRLPPDTTFEFFSLPILPNQLLILQEMMKITLHKLQKAEKSLKKAGEDHSQCRIILKELSRNIRISNLNAEEIHEILKVIRVSVATTSTFLKCIEKTSRVSRFFISEGILHLRHSLGEISEKKLRALTYKPNYVILLFNIKIPPTILPDENTLNNICCPKTETHLDTFLKSKNPPPSKASSRKINKSRSKNSSKILKNNLENDEIKNTGELAISSKNEYTTEKIAVDENLTESRIRIPELFSSISKEIVEEQKKDEVILLVKEENNLQQQQEQQQQPVSTFFLPPSLTESSSTLRDRKIFADVHVEMEKLQKLILDGISKAYSTLSLPNTAVWPEDGKMVPQILGLISVLATATTSTRPYSEILPIYKSRIRGALIELNMATNLGSRNKDIVQDVGHELARINDHLETMTNLLFIKQHSHESVEKTQEEDEQQKQQSAATKEKEEQECPSDKNDEKILTVTKISDEVNSSSCDNSQSIPINNTDENPNQGQEEEEGQEQEKISLAELESLQKKCSLWQIRWDSPERLVLKHRKSNKLINFHNMTLTSKCEVLIAMIQFSRIIILTTGEHLKVAKENLHEVNRIFKKIVKSLEKVQAHQNNKNNKKLKQKEEENFIINKKRKRMTKNEQTTSTSSSSGSASSSSSLTMGHQVNFTSLVSKVKSTHTEAVHFMGKINATLSQVASILFVVNNYLKLLSNWENYYQNSSSSSTSASSGRSRGVQSLTFQQIFHGKMDEAEEYIRKLYLFPINLYIPLKINPINPKQVVI